jgi:hypothetical protein
VLVATVATQVLVVLEEAPVLIILLSEGIGSALVLLRSSSFFHFFSCRASCVGTSHCGTCRPLQQHPILQQYHELWGKGCGGSRLCRSRDCKLNSSLTGHPERQKQNTKVAGAVSNIGPVLWTESIDQPVLSDPSFFFVFF